MSEVFRINVDDPCEDKGRNVIQCNRGGTTGRRNRPPVLIGDGAYPVVMSEQDVENMERRIIQRIHDGECRAFVGTVVDDGDIVRTTFSFLFDSENGELTIADHKTQEPSA